MNREKVKRKKTTKMPLVERATTTTANGLSRRHRIILPPIRKSKEIDVDYLQALKVIDRTRRQEERTPIPVISKSLIRWSDSVNENSSKSSYQFSSTLTSVGQEAMMKTYEDTLISHLTDVYSSKRIANVLPRLKTPAFRRRLPVLNDYSQNRLDSIHQAQILIDNILSNNRQKDKILGDYVKWQHQWTTNC